VRREVHGMGLCSTLYFFVIPMVTPVPTLSTQGWVTDLSGKIDILLSHYVSTDQAQSNIYREYVSSLQALVEQYSGDPLATADAIARSVQTYLGRYYENVIAEARFSLVDEKESQTTVKITLSLNFTEEGVNYTANRLLTYYNGKFKEITEANNG
jgi:hypothetical protein